jgi:hypothetical protein
MKINIINGSEVSRLSVAIHFNAKANSSTVINSGITGFIAESISQKLHPDFSR